MAATQQAAPFFRRAATEFKLINECPEEALEQLIINEPFEYKKVFFRAFLHLNQQECETMSLREYIRYTICLDEVLKTIHAPYLRGKD